MNRDMKNEGTKFRKGQIGKQRKRRVELGPLALALVQERAGGIYEPFRVSSQIEGSVELRVWPLTFLPTLGEVVSQGFCVGSSDVGVWGRIQIHIEEPVRV